MAGLVVTDRRDCGVTMVSNRFIDRFLPEANGEFVKVYLLLLRQISEGKEVSVSHMADGLNNTEKDVLRALKYWEKMKLLKLEYGTDKRLSGIVLLEAEPDSRMELPVNGMAAAKTAAVSETAAAPERAAVSEAAVTTEAAVASERNFVPASAGKTRDLQVLEKDEDFCQLLYLAGRYTGKNLTPRDCDVLANLYGKLGMSAELLEYLVEYCVSNGHKSMRYIETVALNWNERGIKTVEQARAETVSGGKNTYAVLKAFGLGGRNPAAGERVIIDQWFRDYGFPVDVVLEACDRTMRAIHQPSFEYADKILRDWKEKGVLKKADIARLDGKGPGREGREPRKERGEQTSERKPEAKRSNKFHNFPQRDYDCDELVKELNGF